MRTRLLSPPVESHARAALATAALSVMCVLLVEKVPTNTSRATAVPAFDGAPLFGHVTRIRGLITEKEMILANARWIVAAVKYATAIDGDTGEQHGEPMRLHRPEVISGRARARFESAVAVLVGASVPDPARVGFLDKRPEALSIRSPGIVALSLGAEHELHAAKLPDRESQRQRGAA